MAYTVCLTSPGTSFMCPVCTQAVTDAVVTPLATAFTAPAMALHRGVGHTLALVGKRFSVRCGTERDLVPVGVRLHADGRVTDATAERGNGGPAAFGKAPKG